MHSLVGRKFQIFTRQSIILIFDSFECSIYLDHSVYLEYWIFLESLWTHGEPRAHHQLPVTRQFTCSNFLHESSALLFIFLFSSFIFVIFSFSYFLSSRALSRAPLTFCKISPLPPPPQFLNVDSSSSHLWDIAQQLVVNAKFSMKLPNKVKCCNQPGISATQCHPVCAVHPLCPPRRYFDVLKNLQLGRLNFLRANWTP